MLNDKKKILILGGSGFIADSFSKKFKNKYKIFKNILEISKKNHFFDVRNSSLNQLFKVIDKPDVIIYAAGISNHTYCAKNKKKVKLKCNGQ